MTSRPREPSAGLAGPGAELARLLGGPGDVPLRVWPVSDHARLSRAIALLTRIEGIEGVAVERFDARGALMVAHVVAPVTVDSELEARLDRGIVACRLLEGRVDVQLVPRSTGAPRPGSPLTIVGGSAMPPSLRAHHVPPPPAGSPGSSPTGSPGPSDAGSGPVGRSGADGTPAGVDAPTARAAQRRRRWAPAPPPPARPSQVEATGELLEGALRSIFGVSMLVCDARLRVRTISGPAFAGPGNGPAASGRSVRDVLSPGAWRTIAPGLAAALAGEPETFELEGTEPGSRFAATCSPVVDDGVVIGVMVGARDLTDERGEQAELAALRDEFDDVFAHSPISQALLSATGRGVRVSDALCTLLGRPEEELIGEDAASWVHPEDRRGSAARFRRLLAGREDVEAFAFRVLAARGRVVLVRAHVLVLRSPAGWPRGVVFQIEHAER